MIYLVWGSPSRWTGREYFIPKRGVWRSERACLPPGTLLHIILSSFFSSVPPLASSPLSFSCVRKIWVRMRDCVTGLPRSVSEMFPWELLKWCVTKGEGFCSPLHFSLSANMSSSHAHILTQMLATTSHQLFFTNSYSAVHFYCPSWNTMDKKF